MASISPLSRATRNINGTPPYTMACDLSASSYFNPAELSTGGAPDIIRPKRVSLATCSRFSIRRLRRANFFAILPALFFTRNPSVTGVR